MNKENQLYWDKLPDIQSQLAQKIKADPWRLGYHQMPETGWMNDPNGAVYFKGTYHLYHQYVPETPTGGATHWGHKTSKDMVHFQEETIFMSPDQPFDRDGVYSGSAIVVEDKIHFFYTGNVKHEGDHEYTFSGREQNTVHVVSPDGFTIESREVVIPHSAYPEGYTDHIRDPKVFEHAGLFYMILGARTRSNLGNILLYTSKDLKDWHYQGVLLGGDEDQGYMWECPDYFELANQHVLLFSPQGILPTQYHYHNPHAAGYLIGAMNWGEFQFEPQADFKELDHGFDFYAPQTFEDASGRRILWAWMGIGDSEPEYNNPTVARGWQHAMALPRVLTLEDNSLKQRPLTEYKKLRQNKQTYAISEIVAGELKGEQYELLVEFTESPKNLVIAVRQDTQLIYKEGELILKHGESGYGRRKRVIPIDRLSQLQLFSDTSSLEIFVNDGDYVFTSRVYPEEGQDSIRIESDGKGKVSYWDLVL